MKRLQSDEPELIEAKIVLIGDMALAVGKSSLAGIFNSTMATLKKYIKIPSVERISERSYSFQTLNLPILREQTRNNQKER